MDKLTVFYNKRTGSIKELCSGEQSFDWFGDEGQDYQLIYDLIVVDFDSFIFENYMNMKVVDRKLKLVEREIPEEYL